MILFVCLFKKRKQAALFAAIWKLNSFSISISFSVPWRFPMLLWRMGSSRHILNEAKFEMLSKTINQRTLRHPSLQYFRNKNTVIGLIILQDGTDRSCRSTHRSIQHVHILCLEWRSETIRRRVTMINWLIRWVSSLVRNGFSDVEIDSPNNWSMRQVHETCPIQETKLPSRISSPQHYSIHLGKQSIERTIVSAFIPSRERTRDNIHNAIRNA